MLKMVVIKEQYREYLTNLFKQIEELKPTSIEECYMQITLTNYVMKELYLLDNE